MRIRVAHVSMLSQQSSCTCFSIPMASSNFYNITKCPFPPLPLTCDRPRNHNSNLFMESERHLSYLQDIVPHIQSDVHVPSSDQGVPPSVTIFEQTSLGTNPLVLTQHLHMDTALSTSLDLESPQTPFNPVPMQYLMNTSDQSNEGCSFSISSEPTCSGIVPNLKSIDKSPAQFKSEFSDGSTVDQRSEPEEEYRKVPCVVSSLPSVSYPGEFNFSVYIAEGGNGYKYNKEIKHLFIKKNVTFAINFVSSDPLPSSSVIRVIVIYENLTDIEKKGLVRNRIDSDHRFTLCCNQRACYYQHQGHDAVSVPILGLPASTYGPFGVLSFSCTSSELEQKTKGKAPPLFLICSLLVDNEEIGRDVINLRVCACVQRDYKKSLGICQSSRKRSSSDVFRREEEEEEEFDNIHPRMNLVESVKPDKDGNYTFTWKGKSRMLLNIFENFKLAYEIGIKDI